MLAVRALELLKRGGIKTLHLTTKQASKWTVRSCQVRSLGISPVLVGQAVRVDGDGRGRISHYSELDDHRIDGECGVEGAEALGRIGVVPAGVVEVASKHHRVDSVGVQR